MDFFCAVAAIPVIGAFLAAIASITVLIASLLFL